jgi:hypothetical protein
MTSNKEISIFVVFGRHSHILTYHSEEGFYSMADKGDMAKLMIYTKYPIHLIEKINEAHKAREEGERSKAKEIAKNLKLAGVEAKLISITTRLSVEEMEKLK